MKLENFTQANNFDTQRPFSPTNPEYFNYITDLFNKHNVQNHDLNPQQWKILEEIIENKNFLIEKLKPLESLHYSLSLVGGSLRDLVMNNSQSINDYDIVISLDYINDVKFNELKQLAQSFSLEVDINNKDFQDLLYFRLNHFEKSYSANGVNFDQNEKKILTQSLHANYYLSEIVKFLMHDVPDIKHFSAKNVIAEYSNHHITSIHQFSLEHHKKIDLIVSDFGYMNFLSTFDVELCKICLDLKKVSIKEDILDNIIQTASMIKDIENNTFSINAIKFSEENQEYFFKKHLLKLLKKYPEFNVNLFSTKPKDQFTSLQNKRWTYAQYLKMNLSFPEKDIIVKKLKI